MKNRSKVMSGVLKCLENLQVNSMMYFNTRKFIIDYAARITTDGSNSKMNISRIVVLIHHNGVLNDDLCKVYSKFMRDKCNSALGVDCVHFKLQENTYSLTSYLVVIK